MSRESDWHVFDKACDITAMAVRGAAENQGVTPAYVGDLFREVHRALAEVVHEMENMNQKAGF
jgi:predicted transcriptional regulator